MIRGAFSSGYSGLFQIKACVRWDDVPLCRGKPSLAATLFWRRVHSDTKKNSCATLWSEEVIVLPPLFSIFTNSPQDLIS